MFIRPSYEWISLRQDPILPAFHRLNFHSPACHRLAQTWEVRKQSSFFIKCTEIRCLPPRADKHRCGRTVYDVKEAPCASSAPNQLPSFHLLSLSQMLHYTQKVRFTTKAQEEVCFTKEGEMLATFDIQNIYILPDQREQTLTVGHSDLRLPPGKELLINDSAVIWRALKGESRELPKDQAHKHLSPPSTQQGLLCWTDRVLGRVDHWPTQLWGCSANKTFHNHSLAPKAKEFAKDKGD